ncbi:Ubiquitin carboxyl-terminal hydrolase isozyme L5 [Cyphellophora attinorum]|uniref:ubiquitinyl hydrolase 1 n=1 Tax=Cyphellophora attinorum TaxID=1664694 RepID=A0A0N1H9Y7_9EURO|nr:Ubiquitin carboxyl-terminal hydrolase isozyme L5 [Phialophora attinorum]KPI44606.1 Ubiquitin carboxyl-terminal hydrolase isozyme L5 [Phialophora attinorum]
MLSSDTIAQSSDLSWPPSTDSANKRSQSPESSQPEVPDNWRGWAELENDPAIFSTLLREWGVPGVEVQEIIELDDLLTRSSDDVYGLILLARWVAPEENADVDVPADLWFANQVSSYSCASVAIMNIINNRRDLNLGSSLNEFRQKTKDMTPKDRGTALDSFDFVRNAHNSFATEIDKLNVEHLLKDEVAKWERKVKAENKTNNGHRHKRRRVTFGKKKTITADDYEEENGFHFVAYAPCRGTLWKMDGLEVLPRKLKEAENESWLWVAAADLQNQMQVAQASGFEFSLMSLVKKQDNLGDLSEIENMRRTREDWGPFIAHMVNLHAEKGDIKELMK